MSLTQRLSNEAASTATDAMTALMDDGFMDIYSGSQPASADTPITTQVLLASLRFGSPAFQPAVNGEALSNPLEPEADCPATGTATWYRRYQADHVTPVDDGSVGETGCNLNLTSVAIVTHGTLGIDQLIFEARRS